MSLELSVVLPAYREGDSLRQLLPVLKSQLAALTPDHEIVVVDTQESVDDTPAVCFEYGVRHVQRTGGNFYGDAMRTGIAAAQGKYLVVMDADGSHNPSFLPSMWAEREKYDVVIGSRYVPGGMTENPAILIAMSYLVNLTFRVAFHLNCRDVTNSFRLYRAGPLKALQLECDNFDLVEEILIKIVNGKTRGTLKEVPVVFERRKAGESKRNLVAFAISYCQTLLRLRKFYAAAKREAAK